MNQSKKRPASALQHFKAVHQRPTRNQRLARFSRLAMKQESVDLEDLSNILHHQYIFTTQMEGGNSNSNSQMHEAQQTRNNASHDDSYPQQMPTSQPPPQTQSHSMKNINVYQNRGKPLQKITGAYTGQQASQSLKGMTSTSQPTSTTNLYHREAPSSTNNQSRQVQPEMLSKGVISHQNISASSISAQHSNERRPAAQSAVYSKQSNNNSGVNLNATKRNYLYCIDTRQIINMINYSMDMMSVPCKTINQTIEMLDKTAKGQLGADLNRKQQIISDFHFQANGVRSKSTTEKGSVQTGPMATQGKGSQAPLDDSQMNEYLMNNRIRCDIFCSGQKDIISLVNYFNHKLRTPSEIPSSSKKQQTLFKKSMEQVQHRSDASANQLLDFTKIFGLDQKTQNAMCLFSKVFKLPLPLPEATSEANRLNHHFVKFTYLVENEKILSKQMFHIDVQRDNFQKTLREIKDLLRSFIHRKYKNCITKIGFNSQQELFNIFNKMFGGKKGFFNNITVRKVLYCFWLSICDIFFQIRLRQVDEQQNDFQVRTVEKLSSTEEALLKNNFHIRLELMTRGRLIYEPMAFEMQMQALHSSLLQQNGAMVVKQTPKELYAKLYPLHQAVFDSNLRMLSKFLKQEADGIFFINKNSLDSCGNTPLMLAVKLGNIDAVKIISDVYADAKLRPLPDLMNAKEIAIAMKHQPILKILISSNQKLKLQFFEQNKNSIFNTLESIPDFQVDLNLTCDSNLFPVFKSVAPSDTYKIYKQGSNLRLDMTLLGLQSFNILKGNISILYKGRGSENSDFSAGDLLIIDNKLETVNNVFNINQENKINQEINNILTGKQIMKKYHNSQSTIQIESDRSNKPIIKNINDYECQKWTLKSKYTMTKFQMNLNQIDQIKGIRTFQEYIQSQEIDYVQLLQIQLNAYYFEMENQNQSKELQQISNLMMNRLTKGTSQSRESENGNMVPNTSRVHLGGTTNFNNGGFSSRENSNMREQYANQQVHTQEDQLNSINEKSGLFGYKRGSIQQAQNNILANNKQIIIKKSSQKQISANLWLSKTYPFDIDQFLPLFHVLSFCSKQIRQFNKFLIKYPLPKNSFPVEARIPLLMTMEAAFSFKNLQLGFRDKSVFEIDRMVSLKQKENMAIYAKQQISYLNQHSSLDTQEDKQARALREIYKLCKTDEGDSADNYDDYGIYRIVDEANAKNNPGADNDGNESENSDKIKELFNQMEDHDYDINNDLLNNQEDAEDEDPYHQRQNSRMNDQEQVIQSRNFASKSSFHEIKNSFTHADMLKIKKGGAPNGRLKSGQFSLQSDITDSVEVSERSYNDKFQKLQIHSFQNVKFMSQLKKNKRGMKVEQLNNNLQHILNEQYNNKVIRNQKPQHLKNQASMISHDSAHMENIYDSKLNEPRPYINKSLGKHQINNNLRAFAQNLRSGEEEAKTGMMVSKPPMAIQNYQGKRVVQKANDLGHTYSNITIGTNAEHSVNYNGKEFMPQPVQDNYLKPPSNNIGNSFVSMGLQSNFDNSSGQFQSQSSFSHFAGLHGNDSRNGQGNAVPSSTNDSTNFAGKSMNSMQSSLMLNPASKQAKVLENLRTKMLRNQGTQNYLNTIESEGNLPTQQFGGKYDYRTSRANADNLSRRSIHSLEEQDEDSYVESIKIMNNSQNFQHSISKNPSSMEPDEMIRQSQIFNYEKQKLNQSSLYPDSNTTQNKQLTLNLNQVISGQRQKQQQDNKLNFFQKVSNFIQESITDRKSPTIPNTVGSSAQQIQITNFNSNLQMTNESKKVKVDSNQQFTIRKAKRHVATPKDQVSAFNLGLQGVAQTQLQIPSLDNKLSKNETPQSNKEGGSLEFSQNARQLQNVINTQLNMRLHKSNSPTYGLNYTMELNRNTTQTDHSLTRDVLTKIPPSSLLQERGLQVEQSPLKEGQIQLVLNQLNQNKSRRLAQHNKM